MEVRKVAVMGSGLMGSGIAEVSARAGYPVQVWDLNEAAVKAGRDRISASLRQAVSRGKLTEGAASFTGSAFVPPPRTINDITAVLDQQKPADPGAAAQARATSTSAASWRRCVRPATTATSPASLCRFPTPTPARSAPSRSCGR